MPICWVELFEQLIDVWCLPPIGIVWTHHFGDSVLIEFFLTIGCPWIGAVCTTIDVFVIYYCLLFIAGIVRNGSRTLQS